MIQTLFDKSRRWYCPAFASIKEALFRVILPLIGDVVSDDGGTGRRGLYAAGDVRANEHIALASMHTVFVREHNRLVPIIRSKFPDFSNDEVYDFTRLIVGSIIQRITYKEFLPLLVGRSFPPYQGYDPEIDPRIENSFSGAAFRFGHSMLSETLTVFDKNQRKVSLPLKDLFFRPELYASYGPGNIIAGLGTQKARKIDTKIVESVRSFLFGPPGSPGSDLAALNIQRGRDHNLPLYNEMREELGYQPAYYFLKRHSFDQNGITLDTNLAGKMAEVYGDVDQVDLWIGGLAEDGFIGGLLGQTFTSIIIEQFLRLREGDRFWYEKLFPNGEWKSLIDQSSFSAVPSLKFPL